MLTYMKYNPRSLTFLGIGSVFRYPDLNKLTLEIDQVYPEFLHSYNGTMRLIHYDPGFSRDWDFLNLYFEKKGFIKCDSPQNMWRSKDNRIEFIIMPEMFTYSVDFFKEIASVCMPQKLIVQDFSGHSINDFFLQTYYSFSPTQRLVFQKKVIFDITYIDESPCSPNMKEFPVVDSEGDFVNFLLVPPEDLLNYLEYPRFKILIKEVYKQKYKDILNKEHTNYRRRRNKDETLFPSEYSSKEDPEKIFEVLKKKLDSFIHALKHFDFPVEKYNDLMRDHLSYDMYKWYTTMNNLI
jgi:hypothetical protein